MSIAGMRITVLDDPAGDMLANLWAWLREDTHGVQLTPVYETTASNGMSGGALAALEAAVLSKEMLGMVVVGVGGWLSARASTRRTRIRVKRGDVEVEIDTANASKANEIAQQLRDAFEEE